jgi:hypothetical protein
MQSAYQLRKVSLSLKLDGQSRRAVRPAAAMKAGTRLDKENKQEGNRPE